MLYLGYTKPTNFLIKILSNIMKSKIKTVCGLEKYEELSKRKGFFNQLRFHWFLLIASLRDIGKEETIKEE